MKYKKKFPAAVNGQIKGILTSGYFDNGSTGMITKIPKAVNKQLAWNLIFFRGLNYLQQSFSLTNMDLNIFHRKLPALCRKAILVFFEHLKVTT